MLFIAAEGFALTPSIRDQVTSHVEKLYPLVPKDTRFEVFMSEPTQHIFMIVMKARAHGKDFVIRFQGENLYRIIETAKIHMQRKIAEEKRHWVHRRHRPERAVV